MAKNPQPIGDILAELMARRGYGRVQGAEALESAWAEAAAASPLGELATQYTRVGGLRRGILEVAVANSTLVQELAFQEQTLRETLKRLLPDQRIGKIRFRVGPID